MLKGKSPFVCLIVEAEVLTAQVVAEGVFLLAGLGICSALPAGYDTQVIAEALLEFSLGGRRASPLGVMVKAAGKGNVLADMPLDERMGVVEH